MSSECEFKADSPISYSMEEGEISSGATSPATIVESNTMDTGVQTNTQPQSPSQSERPQSRTPSEQEPKVKSLVVQVDNTNGQEVRYNSLSERRKHIASRAKQPHEQVRYQPNHQPIANLSYQYNQVHASPLCQSTPVLAPTMQQIYYTNPYSNESQYPPMPVYPPPAAFNPPMPEPMPEPPTELNGTTPVHNRLGKYVNPIIEHYNLVQRGEISNTRPDNLRFPHAVTPRTSKPKSFLHISTYEQSPSTHVSETIWFKMMIPDCSRTQITSNTTRSYPSLIGQTSHTKINYTIFVLRNSTHSNIDFLNSSQQFPARQCKTIKTSTRNMGRDVVHHQGYPQLKQFYSLTEKFLYRYNYKFTLPRNPSLDHVTAKASQDVTAFKAYTHEMFQLSFNFLHPTPKDVQCNNFKVHETKLIHNLMYYTYLRDNLPHESLYI